MDTSDITVITPTGDTPVALKLCHKWMKAQANVNKHKILWIISDDSRHPMCPLVLDREDIKVLHLQNPYSKPGPVSMATNLLTAINHAEGDHIMIMEHDDFYSPFHIQNLVAHLEEYDAAGSVWQHYYNLASRSYKLYRNKGSALCCTAFKRHLLPYFVEAVKWCKEHEHKGMDRRFWDILTITTPHKVNIYDDLKNPTCIGIKGLPGRPGIGVGHRAINYTPDLEGEVLKKWVGDEAYKIYKGIQDEAYPTSPGNRP